MFECGDVPADWDPDARCCLECGNEEPVVRLRVVTNQATGLQALACGRHEVRVAAALG